MLQLLSSVMHSRHHNTVCKEILMCVNLRITRVQFITMSSSTRTVSKQKEIII